MALQLRRGETRSFGKMIITSFAVMAFVLQPLVSLNIPAAFAVAGSDITVSGVSSTFSSVQAAIDAASNGATITVPAGVYNENITINKPIALMGVNSNTRVNGQITLNAGASNSRIHSLNITTSNVEYSLGVLGASNVTIDNNTFFSTSSSTASAKAIYVGDADADNVVIRNNVIRDVRTTAAKGAYGILVNKKNFTNLVIKDNHIKTLKGKWVHAIGLEGNTPNASIQNNHISGLVSSINGSDVHAVVFEDNNSIGSVSVDGDYNGKVMTNSANLTIADSGLANLAPNLEVLNKDGVYRYVGQNAFATAQDAVNAVDTDGTVKLLSDQNVKASILIKKALTFDGNGLSVVSSLGAGATSPYSGVIEVQNVTTGVVKFVANNNKWFRVHGEGNKAIDGPGNYNGLHGINVYQSNIEINNINLENNGKSGLNLGKDSTATVSNLMTNNNMWHGVDVDKGGVLTINSTSKHNESKMHNGKAVASLYADNSTGTVIDASAQYTAVTNYLQQGDTAYFLKHEAPMAAVTVGSLNVGDTTNNKNITITGMATPSVTTGSAIKTHYFELVTPGGETYAIYSDKTSNRCDLNGTNECTFNLGSYYDVDGQYKVRYVVTDTDGIRNDGFGSPAWVTGNNQATFTFTVDATAPAVPVLDPALNGAYFNTTPIKNAWAAATDLNGSGVAGYQVAYSYDDGHSFGSDTDWTTVTINGRTQLTRYTTNLITSTLRNHRPGPGEQGPVTVWVRSIDFAGNVSNWSTSATYTFDSIAPTVELTGVSTAPTNTPPVIATLTFSEPVTGVGGTWTQDTTNPLVYTKAFQANATEIVNFQDVAGNTGSVEVAVANIDTTAPALVVNPYNGTDTTPTITGTTADADNLVTVDGDVATVSQIRNTDDTYSWTYTFTAPFIIGSTNVEVVSTDAAGNFTRNNATVTVVDPNLTLGQTDAPTVDFTPAADQTTGQQEVQGDATSKTPQVEGASTSKSDSDNASSTNGFAWYWWLIIAAVALTLWGLLAAARRRQNEA